MEALVIAAVSVLAAFFKESGQAIGNELGKKIGGVTWEKAKELFQTVRKKLTGGGLEAVEALKNDPENQDVHAMLRYYIKQGMKSDKSFYEEIDSILKQNSRKGFDRTFETIVDGNIEQLNQFNQVHGIGIVNAEVFIQNSTKSQSQPSLEQGIFFLDAGFYDQATKILNTIMSNNPTQADPYYFAALSMLEGGRPEALQYDKAKRIKEYLTTACQLDGRQAHYYYFWAIVQFGYFECKGFGGHPDVSVLLERAIATPVDTGAIRKLLEYLPMMKNNPAYEALAKVACN